MAKVTVKMPEEFIKKMGKLGQNTDKITESVLKAGGSLVMDKVKNNLSGVIGKNTVSLIETKNVQQPAQSLVLYTQKF